MQGRERLGRLGRDHHRDPISRLQHEVGRGYDCFEAALDGDQNAPRRQAQIPDLALLEDTTLTIESTDREGITTVKQVRDFALHRDRDSVYEFNVPDRLASVTFSLSRRASYNVPSGSPWNGRLYTSHELFGSGSSVSKGRTDHAFPR